MEKLINRPPNGRRRIKIIIIFFIVGPAALIAAAAYYIFITKNCDTVECFVKTANDCRTARLEIVDDADMFWRYRSSAFCRGFDKTLILVNDNEPAWMKEALEGKSLSCKYAPGKFDKRWLTSLVFGLENCEGELKETLGQLLFLVQ